MAKPNSPMVTISKHQFGEPVSPDSLTVAIQEIMHEDYGLYVWPSSVVLAEFIYQQKDAFRGKKVLELGAGTALPGIVAAKVGASVILTDHTNKTEVFDNLRGTCRLNNVECQLQGLTWGELDGTAKDLPPLDFIIGADVLYESRDFENLFSTVRMLLEHSNSGAMFITAYQHRSGHYSIEYLLTKWRLQSLQVIAPHDFLPSDKASRLGSIVEIAILCLSSDTPSNPHSCPSLKESLANNTLS